MRPNDRPAAPRHLSTAARKWWRDVLAEYRLGPHELRILQLACEAWDASRAAREQLEQDGRYVTDRYGQVKCHPAVADERDSRLAFMRAVRELALSTEPADSRPPRLGGRR